LCWGLTVQPADKEPAAPWPKPHIQDTLQQEGEANFNGTAPFQFLRMKPLRSTFGKQNGAASFFVWLESALE
jgi:hypothetical protein